MVLEKPKVTRSDKARQCLDEKASAYFSALDIALARGDYEAAAKAQQVLADLGWVVKYRRPSDKPQGREVAS